MNKEIKNYIWIQEKHFSINELEKNFELFRKANIIGILCRGEKEFIQKIIPIAKDFGLEVHYWIITLLHNKQELLQNHPDWYNISRNGNSSIDNPPYVDYYKWLCPTKSEVQKFILDWIKDLSEIEDLDGIHLDYIRYPDVILPKYIQPTYDLKQDREFPEFDFCYCEDCRNAFKKQTGIDPLDLQDPASSNDWLQFRLDNVTNLVEQIIKLVHQHQKKITAAVFPIPEQAKRFVRQDWTKWDLDAVFPMNYYNFYEKNLRWIEKAVESEIQAIPKERPLYSGLFIPETKPGFLQKSIDYSISAGAKGISIFDFGAMTEKHWEILCKTISPDC